MKAIKYYGVFRGCATAPIAAFAVEAEAQLYASQKRKVTVRPCYMDYGYLCTSCNSLVRVAPDEPAEKLCPECETGTLHEIGPIPDSIPLSTLFRCTFCDAGCALLAEGQAQEK